MAYNRALERWSTRPYQGFSGCEVFSLRVYRMQDSLGLMGCALFRLDKLGYRVGKSLLFAIGI